MHMLAAGSLIDERYEILDTLGVGGFGAVFKARQKQFDRFVAVKFLNDVVLQQRDGAARFEREAKAISALKHVNIIGFYGYGVWQEAPYMVMEFFAGDSMQSRLSHGAMDAERALPVITQIFEGLSSAHAAGVVHRDLKPSNILLDKQDAVKIIDFGLAKLMPSYGVPGQKLTETGYTLGTCSYMPPEQALGVPVEPRADIYSAGCIMYEMLAGRPPFVADDNVAVMYMHINEQPKPLTELLPASRQSQALWFFVQKCMAKRPEDRYADARMALKDLDAIKRGQFERVQPPAVLGQSARPSKKSIGVRVATIIIAQVAAVSAGILVYESMQRKPVVHPANTALADYTQIFTVGKGRLLTLLTVDESRRTLQRLLTNAEQADAFPTAAKLDVICALAVVDSQKRTAPADYLQHLRDALALRRQVRSPSDDCLYYEDYKMARASRALGEPNLAETFANLGIQLHEPGARQLCSLELAEMAYASGDYKKAQSWAKNAAGDRLNRNERLRRDALVSGAKQALKNDSR
jgi:serine/threonine protein kinase